MITLGFLAIPAFAHKPLMPPPNFLTDDAALIKRITSDRRFHSVQNCRDPGLTRFPATAGNGFKYLAVCDMRPQSDDRCRSYRVSATGTVDKVQTYSAFVHEVTLTTLCEAGANKSFKPKPLRGSA